ncbi:MAG: hypothetical protein LBK99_08350 [Opitutaceae bacterium]|nr:hypothetical protein [Opitutaceae bacterium]
MRIGVEGGYGMRVIGIDIQHPAIPLCQSHPANRLTSLIQAADVFAVDLARPDNATCTGSASCRACSSCRYCGHCAKMGGSCGVCSRVRHTESPRIRL